MTPEGEVTPSKVLDPFTHTKEDWNKIINFNFIRENSTTDREKVTIEETFCTLVAVGGKYLEKKAFKMVLKKIDEIRKSESIIKYFTYSYKCTFKRLNRNKSDFFH